MSRVVRPVGVPGAAPSPGSVVGVGAPEGERQPVRGPGRGRDPASGRAPVPPPRPPDPSELGGPSTPVRRTHRWGIGAYVVVEAVFVGVSMLIGFAFLGRPVSVVALTVALAVPTVLAAGVADAHHPAAGQRAARRPRPGLVVARRAGRSRVRDRRARRHDPGVVALRRAGGPGAGQLGGRRRVRGAAGRPGRRAGRRARRGRAGAAVRGDRLPRACCGGRWSATRCRAGCRSW